MGDLLERFVEAVDDLAEHGADAMPRSRMMSRLIPEQFVGPGLVPASDLEEVTRSEVIKYSAGGFRDFTRIASSDVVMWRDIALANREALLAALDSFTRTLDSVREAVASGDAEGLEQVFSRARAARERYLRWLEHGVFS
jgi:hypothetical protein